MELEARLAGNLLAAHPIDAAQAFERLPAREVADLLREMEPGPSARALQHMTRHAASAVVSELDDATRLLLFERLDTGLAALLLRHMEGSSGQRLLDGLSSRRARALRSLLAHPEGSAGALMDPTVLALARDVTVEEAIGRIREAAEHARYNVYIVDRDQVLVGVVNLRELLMAPPTASLASLMKTAVHRLPARAGRREVVSHPGWREVHALPVVDEGGRYLGTIRYRTMRRIEEGLLGDGHEEAATARALGDLLRAGASAVLEALVSSEPPAGRRVGHAGRREPSHGTA